MNYAGDYKFYPPYDPPKTREEFIACHRAYWTFIFENQLNDKPKIVSEEYIPCYCYGCMFMETIVADETDWGGPNGELCEICPLKRACDLYFKEYYEDGDISAAKKIAEAEWDFSKVDEFLGKR